MACRSGTLRKVEKFIDLLICSSTQTSQLLHYTKQINDRPRWSPAEALSLLKNLLDKCLSYFANSTGIHLMIDSRFYWQGLPSGAWEVFTQVGFANLMEEG